MKTKSPIPFRGFDERGEVRVYHHGMLPHWRQKGCTYFVTFRQADSLPQRVLGQLDNERRLWLTNHRIHPDDAAWKCQFAKLSRSERRDYERRVATRLNDFLDAGHGSCALGDPSIGASVAQSLDHFHEERVVTGDLAVMPNHVHVLMTPLAGHELEDILQSIKSYSATQINRRLGTEGTFWQRESYDHIVRDYEQLEAFQRYIANNPEKAGLRRCDCVLSRAEYSPAT